MCMAACITASARLVFQHWYAPSVQKSKTIVYSLERHAVTWLLVLSAQSIHWVLLKAYQMPACIALWRQRSNSWVYRHFQPPIFENEAGHPVCQIQCRVEVEFLTPHTLTGLCPADAQLFYRNAQHFFLCTSIIFSHQSSERSAPSTYIVLLNSQWYKAQRLYNNALSGLVSRLNLMISLLEWLALSCKNGSAAAAA